MITLKDLIFIHLFNKSIVYIKDKELKEYVKELKGNVKKMITLYKKKNYYNCYQLSNDKYFIKLFILLLKGSWNFIEFYNCIINKLHLYNELNKKNLYYLQFYINYSNVDNIRTTSFIIYPEIIPLFKNFPNFIFPYIIDKQSIEIISQLINNSKFNKTDKSYCIFHLCELNNYDKVKFLLDNNLSLSMKYSKGNALHMACNNNNYDLVKLLLSFNCCNVNGKNKNGETPLHIACQKYNLEITRLLIQNGAKINIKNNLGQLPIIYAIKTFNELNITNLELITLLINKSDVSIKDLFECIEKNSVNIYKLFLTYKIKLE